MVDASLSNSDISADETLAFARGLSAERQSLDRPFVIRLSMDSAELTTSRMVDGALSQLGGRSFDRCSSPARQGLDVICWTIRSYREQWLNLDTF